jgi:hypothetical protein
MNRRWYPAARSHPARVTSRGTSSESKGAHLLERMAGVEPATYTLATCRSATELHPQLQALATMRVLPHLPGPMPDSEHRKLPRTSAHQPPALLQPSQIVRDRSSARHCRDGPGETAPGLALLSESPRFARCLDDVFQFSSHFISPVVISGGCGWTRTTVLFENGFTVRRLRRSATHPKLALKMHKARSPFGASGPCGLRSFDLVVRGLFSQPGCLFAHSNRSAHIQTAH